ncbi:SsgA family sporulation/cell division regulator [Streptomyces sp. B1866]|uniref:SsgA family sporulation/cell division regulator n=1 Tax=Streptomyces sp. B1866 TaxID=3075431 RepID=UPI00288E3BDB|nr:SsgA family sporulation/cell division regulator [Streptomyces sp. B1866]MDT3396917.1 SsgA family sporulation/cell division regulator [Streptomyces sp. B1866]
MHFHVVERELEMNLVLSPERSVPVPARLSYRTSDPYAVHIVFHTGSESPVEWSFARELLLEGVFRPCGQGDVRVWPSRADGRTTVCMSLTSPNGAAQVEAPASVVSAWLERTLRAVPPGQEHEQYDIDAALAGLLARTPRDGAARRHGQDEPRPGGGPAAGDGIGA